MLAVYISMPEVENDRRALNVRHGMRRGKKKVARWVERSMVTSIKRGKIGTKYIALNDPEATHMKWAFEKIAENV